jgi:two-component system, cell cycle sensor histidine kinase and response regulator CckA
MEPRSTHVLVVGGDHQFGAIVEGMLVHAGHFVIKMESPLDALMWVVDPNTHVDLVITELVMPVVSGPQLANWIWLRCPDLPVIYLTDLDDRALIERGLGDRLEWVLQKPFWKEDLLGRVSSAIGRYHR